jgi:hypothetical protein
VARPTSSPLQWGGAHRCGLSTTAAGGAASKSSGAMVGSGACMEGELCFVGVEPKLGGGDSGFNWCGLAAAQRVRVDRDGGRRCAFGEGPSDAGR